MNSIFFQKEKNFMFAYAHAPRSFALRAYALTYQQSIQLNWLDTVNTEALNPCSPSIDTLNTPPPHLKCVSFPFADISTPIKLANPWYYCVCGGVETSIVALLKSEAWIIYHENPLQSPILRACKHKIF